METPTEARRVREARPVIALPPTWCESTLRSRLRSGQAQAGDRGRVSFRLVEPERFRDWSVGSDDVARCAPRLGECQPDPGLRVQVRRAAGHVERDLPQLERLIHLAVLRRKSGPGREAERR